MDATKANPLQLELDAMEHPGMQAAHEAEQALYCELAAVINARRRNEVGDAAVEQVLDALFATMERHFAEEDQMMLELRFPPYPHHAGEHRQVLASVVATIARWRATRDLDLLMDQLLGTHLSWMKRHVATMDYLTARFINMASAAQQARTAL